MLHGRGNRKVLSSAMSKPECPRPAPVTPDNTSQKLERKKRKAELAKETKGSDFDWEGSGLASVQGGASFDLPANQVRPFFSGTADGPKALLSPFFVVTSWRLLRAPVPL
jgi:hypothetical protein